MRAIFCGFWVAFALVAMPLAAQETKLGEEGADSPLATLEQVDWLVGQWEGIGIGGARAVESWLPPSGGTMVGSFIQETDEGAIRFTEHLYLMEEGGTLVLRLKHFNADLTGWEEKDDMLAFRLVAIEPCAAFFRGLTLRCAEPERPGEGLVAAVRMRSEGDEVRELVFRFDAMEPRISPVCRDAVTTYDMVQCGSAVLALTDERREQYLAKAKERHSQLAELIEVSSAAFLAYRDAECGAYSQQWMGGTIRGPLTLSCRIEMTQQRTHEIWQSWLHYADSTPPMLPEPKPITKEPREH